MKENSEFWNIVIDGVEIKVPKNSADKLGVCPCCIEKLKPLYEFLKNEFDDSGQLLNVTKILIRIPNSNKERFCFEYEIENLFVIIFDSETGFSIPAESNVLSKVEGSQIKAHITIDPNQLAHMLELPTNPLDLYKRYEGITQINYAE